MILLGTDVARVRFSNLELSWKFYWYENNENAYNANNKIEDFCQKIVVVQFCYQSLLFCCTETIFLLQYKQV